MIRTAILAGWLHLYTTIMANSGLNFVQLADGSASATPLILIHDGGGTVLSYKALGSLDRDVYGISNPRFDNGQPWEGGIPEMARSYTQMIKARIPKGDLLLGGAWARNVLGGVKFLCLQ